MPKRVHSASDRDDDAESSQHLNASKRARKAPELTHLCQELYDTLRAYKSEDGKLLCEHFLRLPSKSRANADYYSTIKDPIDLTQIQEKLHKNDYQTFEEFLDDLELLFSNAKSFYRKNSNEWKDANELSKYVYSKLDSSKQQATDSYYFEEFFTAIYNAQNDERPITDIFLFLPSRKIYPDYYLIVTKPIDLKMIAMKIQKQDYRTLEDMENDLLLMISNARKYNDPKSQIYKDACALKKIITNVRNELETAGKSSNDRLRLRQRDVLLSSEVAAMEYPEEPEDDEIIQPAHDDADSETSSLADEDDSYRILYNAVKNYKLGAQSLVDPFMKLPNRRFHQDYYEEIKRPIAMSLIKNHIQKGKYTHLGDLVDDLQLMFDNAMQYNQEGSLIFNSAKKLLDVALIKAHELGFDESKPRLKEPRPTVPLVTVKDEYLDSSYVPSPNSQRGRPPKKSLKTPEQNIQSIYTHIREYRENDIGLIAPFLQLPSAEEYPDYYETIDQPIDMSMIKEKLDKGLYKREQEIVDDLNRMFSNAKIYNVDESYIFKYASRLEQALAAKYKSLVHQKKERFSQVNRIVTKTSLNTLQDKLTYLIQSIKTYADRHGRTLSTPFLTLPSKIDYPDYYEIIARPIDLKRIESRSYSSMDELVSDLQQLFDNACLYNEPGSMIYRDALTLQKLLLDKNRELRHHEHDVLHVSSLVHELLISLFIRTFNYQDQEDRYVSESFTEFADPVDNEPFDLVYTFDLARQNLDQRRYRRLDTFQDDLFKVFERVRRLCLVDSEIYDDSIKLQKHYIHLRDEMCSHGALLRSPALLFNEDRLKQELIREQIDKGSTNISKAPNSTSTVDENDALPSKAQTSTEKSSSSKGQAYYLGDFVYIDPVDESNEPTILCIESFEKKNNEDYFHGLQFLRPNETFHTPTQKFLRQEVFLTQTVECISMNKIQGLCYVLHVKDYFKYRPSIADPSSSLREFQDEDVYVCESRYNMRTKMFKKVKSWNVPENTRVHLTPRDTILDSSRLPSTLVHHHHHDLQHRSSTTDSESTTVDVIDKVKESIPYDAVINEKFNENLPVKRIFYEQIVLSSNSYYKVGDYVYVLNTETNNHLLDKRSILRIEKIWKEKDSYTISGPFFLQSSDIVNRDQLIVTTKCSYDREVIKRDGPSTQISSDKIKGKCSVLSLKHYCTYRLTEIPESDVYVCESKYVTDDHSLRNLTKPLKRISLSIRALPDEIWTFRKELLLKQDTTGGMLKVLEDGSTMDIDDQNSSHADGDDHPSNHLNFDATNSHRHNNNNNRKSHRRSSSTTRPPCGYLVFASESRKRLVHDNPGIAFGEMSRIIGDQWRRLPPMERDKFEEKARERAREQDAPLVNSAMTYDPSLPPPRMINGAVAINGYHPMNGPVPIILKAAPAPVVARCPPRIQRLLHSETYFRYIEHLRSDHPFISDWPKQLKASISNPGNLSSRALPSQWLLNNSPGLYNNVYEALWSMRDHMWSDVIRVRNVLSDEW